MGNTRHYQAERSEEALTQLHFLVDTYYTKQEGAATVSHKTIPHKIAPRYKDFGQISFADLEVLSSLPEHPLWSQVERLIDFTFADQLCAPLYSTRGQYPYAPSLKLKAHLVQRNYGWSDREMENEMIYNLAVKQFLRVPIAFKGLDHSTLALDRDRLGSELFDACHQVILAQVRALGLWGSQTDEKWRIDAFHTHSHIQKKSSYRLILDAANRVLDHLKHHNQELYTWLSLQFPADSWKTTTVDDLSYSKLVAQCYALMMWLENGPLHDLFWSWPDKRQQLHALELQAILCTILRQNSRPVTPSNPPGKSKPGQDRQTAEQTLDTDEETRYERIPRKEREGDRIISVVDPEVRIGHKSTVKKFAGDKYQIIESVTNGIILDLESIASNEHDGYRMVEMVDRIEEIHEVKPKEISGDSHYGIGQNREEMEARKIELYAPQVENPRKKDGYLEKRLFTYDDQAQTVTCPNKQTTSRRVRNNQEKGYQFIFDPNQCQDCPLHPKCTKAAKRTIFISDYYEQHQRAEKVNCTAAFDQAMKDRQGIERTNNECKNIIGMKHSWERSREKRRIQGKLAAMVMNIRIVVRKLCPSVPPIQRRQALPCP